MIELGVPKMRPIQIERTRPVWEEIPGVAWHIDIHTVLRHHRLRLVQDRLPLSRLAD